MARWNLARWSRRVDTRINPQSAECSIEVDIWSGRTLGDIWSVIFLSCTSYLLSMWCDYYSLVCRRSSWAGGFGVWRGAQRTEKPESWAESAKTSSNKRNARFISPSAAINRDCGDLSSLKQGCSCLCAPPPFFFCISTHLHLLTCDALCIAYVSEISAGPPACYSSPIPPHCAVNHSGQSLIYEADL